MLCFVVDKGDDIGYEWDISTLLWQAMGW